MQSLSFGFSNKMNVEKKTIFEFPYFITKIDPQKYNKNEIIYSCIENYNKQPFRNTWDIESDLHHSFNDEKNPIFKKIDYSLLYPLYISAFNDVLKNIKLYESKNDWKLKIVNYTVTSKNQFMKPHHHFPSHFSGVHYIKFDKEKDKLITFKNPFKIFLDNFDPNFYKCFIHSQKDNTWMFSNISLEIEEDDFIIFPSILEHFIPKTSSDSKRISIATNIYHLDNTTHKITYN